MVSFQLGGGMTAAGFGVGGVLAASGFGFAPALAEAAAAGVAAMGAVAANSLREAEQASMRKGRGRNTARGAEPE